MQYRFTSEEVRNLLFDYNSIDGVLPKNRPERVYIWDETLRDGEQSPGVYLTKQEKIEIAKALDEIGVKIIAIGFPAISEGEFETVKAVAHEELEHSTVVAIARPRRSDIDKCLGTDVKEIVLFMPISPLMMKVLKLTPQEEYKTISEMITYAREHGLRVNWVSEDTSRAEPEHMIKVFRTAAEAGAIRIVISDTVGVLNPHSTAYIVKMVKEKVITDHPNLELGIHTHNDFGLAVANTIEGVFHGVTYPHTCVNGYGERAGNAAFEEVVMSLEKVGISTGIKLEKIYELSRLVEKYFCLPLSAHKPIVGAFSFSHESGLHVNAILTHPMTYEPINPKLVGRKRKFYLGKLSGSGAIINALSEKLKLMDMDFPPHIIRRIVNEVKSAQEKASKSDIKKIFERVKKDLEKLTSGVTDRKFYEIVKKVCGPDLEKYMRNNKTNE